MNKDHPWETKKAVFVERWSLFRGQFRLEFAIWEFRNTVFVQWWSLFGGAGLTVVPNDNFKFGSERVKRHSSFVHVHSIDPNVRDAVYCTAIAEGDSSHWEFALQQYKEATATERTRLMNSLACTRSTWLINRYSTAHNQI